MKITIEDIQLPDGTKETKVFNDVSDAYVAIRFPEMHRNGDALVHVIHTRSYSYGPGIRDLLKELRQSIVELEYQRKADQDGRSE